MAALAAVPSVVSAQQKTLYVAGYGGSFEKTIRDEVIPAFEKANGVKARICRRQLDGYAGQNCRRRRAISRSRRIVDMARVPGVSS